MTTATTSRSPHIPTFFLVLLVTLLIATAVTLTVAGPQGAAAQQPLSAAQSAQSYELMSGDFAWRMLV